jgi:16S rRNA (cytosine1402-N4)-methyltransferase
VLLAETLSWLDPKPDGLYVDATLGGGGYSRGILRALGPGGRLLALDLDPEPLEWAAEWGRGDGRLILRRGNFADLPGILGGLGLGPADGIVADLGLSSRQFLGEGRGFSFRGGGPLDMRLDPGSPGTAADLVNGLGQRELEALIAKGGEPLARRMARLIVARRERKPFEGADELSELALKAYGPRGRKSRTHPATRLFLALRMAVNREAESLSAFLAGARGCLREGGRLLVVSFQSSEDRLVKGLLRSEAMGFRDLRKGGLAPSAGELSLNPKARSARLRGGVAVGPKGADPKGGGAW